MSMEADAQTHLYKDLRERLQSCDKQREIDIYYELLSSGHSVKEILSTVDRICSASERDASAMVEVSGIGV